jgi:hypothetical protein
MTELLERVIDVLVGLPAILYGCYALSPRPTNSAQDRNARTTA